MKRYVWIALIGAAAGLLYAWLGRTPAGAPPRGARPDLPSRRAATSPPSPWTAASERTPPATGLSAQSHAPRRRAASDPVPEGEALGLTAGLDAAALGAPPAATSSTNEWPVFSELRASRGRPLAPEVVALAESITGSCTTDVERARALYDWITAHIRYDWKEWANVVGGASGHLHSHDPASVLARGDTICTGYAWLYNDLIRAVGMESNFVIGEVRGYRGTLDDTLVSPYQHAWNAVQIDGQWRLLDATWGARQDGESETDYLARRDYYYRTPASQMIFDHYPESADWQLLQEPLPAETFASLPNLKPAFFRDGLRLGNAFSDTLALAPGQRAAVILSAPLQVEIAAALTRDGRDVSAAHLAVEADGVRRDIALLDMEPGDYLLRVYSRPVGARNSYECAIDYAVKVAP